MSNQISQIAINDEGFLFHPQSGESFTVNSTGLWIIKKLKENMDAQELMHQLETTFEIDATTAERDLLDFLDHLKTLRLL